MKNILLLVTGLVLSTLSLLSHAADRNILWDKVHNQCEPNYNKQGSYAPCSLVDTEQDYVFYKVDNDQYQYLLMPINKVTGIEDQQLLSEDAPHYFNMAWGGRDLVAEKTGHKIREKDISLTLNSLNTRSQDQMHIHISCLAKPVREALDRFETDKFDNEWHPFPEKLQDYDLLFKKISGDDLKNRNLIRTVNQKVVQDGYEMQYATIAVVNLDKSHFLMLLGEGSLEHRIGAEKLQDHSCALME